jgi:hypothetical protein
LEHPEKVRLVEIAEWKDVGGGWPDICTVAV